MYQTGADRIVLRGYETLHPSAKRNFAVACAAYESWSKASGQELVMALEAGMHSQWPGRCQSISQSPEVIVDGAHNPDGASWLAGELRSRFPATRFHLLFGVKEGKDAQGILDALQPIVSRVTFISDAEGMLLPAHILKRTLTLHTMPLQSTEDSLASLLQNASGPTLVAGSLFLVGEAILALDRQSSLIYLQ